MCNVDVVLKIFKAGYIRTHKRLKVKEYMCERCATRGEGLDQARRECLDREKWRLFCLGHPDVSRSRRERGVRRIDR